MTPPATAFSNRYGPWAVVAGGSMGMGAAFARQLAARGLNLVLVADAARPLEDLAATLRDQHSVEVRTVVTDLAQPRMLEVVEHHTADLEVGLLVCNAAFAPIAPFVELSLEDKLRVVDLNCRAPVALIHLFAPAMVSRGHGGAVLMSSLAGLQGTALVATYAASKAFDLVLGEALWEELRSQGVDVAALCAGPTRTEAYQATRPRPLLISPPVMEADAVVLEALDALGQGPSRVAGPWNRLTATIMRRLPRRVAVSLMGHSMRKVYPHRAGSTGRGS